MRFKYVYFINASFNRQVWSKKINTVNVKKEKDFAEEVLQKISLVFS